MERKFSSSILPLREWQCHRASGTWCSLYILPVRLSGGAVVAYSDVGWNCFQVSEYLSLGASSDP
jgi:hypothetical protein